MPVSSDIYSQIQQPKPVNQLANMAQALQLQGAVQENTLNSLKMQDAESNLGRKNKLMDLVGGWGAGTTDDQRAADLKNRGYFDEADKLDKGILERRKIESTASKDNAEAVTKRVNIIGQAMGALKDDPSLENANATIDFLEQIGIYKPDDAMKYRAKVAANPAAIGPMANIAFRAALDASKQLPNTVQMDLGNQKKLAAVDSVTGRPTITGTYDIGQSPDNVATNATSRANNAATVAATMRGQNMTDARERFINGQGGKAPAGYRWGADGSLEAIKGGPADKAVNPSEGERKAASLLMRMEGSQRQLQTALGENPDAATPGVWASGARAMGMDAIANKALTSSERQRVEAAQLDMLDAALTLGTGAAYTREQLEGYRRSYFPQTGDSPANILDKQARLNNVIQAAHIAAGRAGPSGGKVGAQPQTGTGGSLDMSAIDAEIARRRQAGGR